MMILDYNEKKAGVDTLHQLVRAYSCKRRTRRWPMCLFYNIIDIAAYNTFVIFRNLHPEWNAKIAHRRRLFLIHLARSLLNLQAPTNRAQANIPEQPREVLASRRRCFLCGYQKDRKTRVICHHCRKPVCTDHSTAVCINCL